MASSKSTSSAFVGSEDVELPLTALFNTLAGLMLGVFSVSGRFLHDY